MGVSDFVISASLWVKLVTIVIRRLTKNHLIKNINYIYQNDFVNRESGIRQEYLDYDE